MKIKVTNEFKKSNPFMDKFIIDEIRECCAEDSIKNYVSSALSIAGVKNPTGVEVYDKTAEISRNYRIWNYYGDCMINTEDFDVWIEFKAFVEYEGFYIIGVYLSDLWNRLADYSNDAEIRSHMYIEKYTKKGIKSHF